MNDETKKKIEGLVNDCIGLAGDAENTLEDVSAAIEADLELPGPGTAIGNIEEECDEAQDKFDAVCEDVAESANTANETLDDIKTLLGGIIELMNEKEGSDENASTSTKQ